MKNNLNVKKLFFLVVFLVTNALTLFASPTLVSFAVSPWSPPLQNGQIVVSTSTPTYAHLSFTFTVPQVYNSSTGRYEVENVAFIVRAVYVANGVEENLSQEYQFNSTNSPFNGGLGTFIYDLTIPAGKIGGQIKLKYHYRCTHSGGIFTQAQFAPNTFTTYPTVTPPQPPPATYTEGAFIKNDITGEIFVGFGGKYRRIISLGSVTNLTNDYGIFNKSSVDNSLYHTNSNLSFSPIGSDIGDKIERDGFGNLQTVQTASLEKDTDGKIYLIESLNGMIAVLPSARWITNTIAFDFYKFDNTKVINRTTPIFSGNWGDPTLGANIVAP